MTQNFHPLRLAALALLAAAGCTPREVLRAPVEPPPADLTPTRIDYVDSDAFDALLESALVNQDPAIVIRTGHAKPDWGARLNAWIAAWNRGGRVGPGVTVRGQAPFLPRVVVDGDSIREFRLLIEGLMSRLEAGVKERSAWWAQEKVRERRVELLRPYNLRFHLGEDGLIQIILFNGRYARYHAEFVRSIGGAGEEWQRGYICSHCRQAARGGAPDSPMPSPRPAADVIRRPWTGGQADAGGL
jgi:hypothetical protein